MNSDKTKLLIAVIILILAIILRVFFYDNRKTNELEINDNNKTENKEENEDEDIIEEEVKEEINDNIKYYMIDNHLVFSIEGNNLNYLSYDDLLKVKLNIYADGKYDGKYYIRMLPNGLKVFDDNNNIINYDEKYLIGSNKEILVSEFNVEEVSSNEYVIADNFFISEGITTGFDNNVSTFIKYKEDYNNDGVFEYIYSLSNVIIDGIVYSYLFTYYNNEYKIINSSKDYKLLLVGILDINDDNQFDIVVSKFKDSSIYYEIYTNNNMIFSKFSVSD